MNKFLKTLAAAMTVLAIAGCAQLPRSGEIKVGPEIQGDMSSDYLYYSPSGPAAGETQQDILNGFINAGTGPQNDYEAAREYLTEHLPALGVPLHLALGVFDGVHVGHQAVIERAVKAAERQGARRPGGGRPDLDLRGRPQADARRYRPHRWRRSRQCLGRRQPHVFRASYGRPPARREPGGPAQGGRISRCGADGASEARRTSVA